MKKNLFALLLFIANAKLSFAQSTIVYEYDASGNRIHRNIGKKNSDNNDSTSDSKTEKITQMVGEYKFFLGPSPTTGIIEGYVENYQGEGVIVAVNVANGQNCIQHFDRGMFCIDISNLPDGIYALQLVVISNGQTIQNNDVKIIKKS